MTDAKELDKESIVLGLAALCSLALGMALQPLPILGLCGLPLVPGAAGLFIFIALRFGRKPDLSPLRNGLGILLIVLGVGLLVVATFNNLVVSERVGLFHFYGMELDAQGRIEPLFLVLWLLSPALVVQGVTIRQGGVFRFGLYVYVILLAVWPLAYMLLRLMKGIGLSMGA